MLIRIIVDLILGSCSLTLALTLRSLFRRVHNLEAVVTDGRPLALASAAKDSFVAPQLPPAPGSPLPDTATYKQGRYCGTTRCLGRAAPKCQNALCMVCCNKYCPRGGHS